MIYNNISYAPTNDPSYYEEAKKAYYIALETGLTEELQNTACKHAWFAYLFGVNVKDANIEYCQKAACRYPAEAYNFAVFVKGADVEYCKKYMGRYLEDFLRREMRQALM